MADEVVRAIPEEMVARAVATWYGVEPDDTDEADTKAAFDGMREVLSAALAGRQVVDLPEPDHVETDEANPGKGSAHWRISDLRPARAAVIVSRGVADQPILMIDGLIWEIAEARKVAEMFLAAARYAERLAARAASGSGSGEGAQRPDTSDDDLFTDLDAW